MKSNKKTKDEIRNSIKTISATAMLFALALSLSFLEGLIPMPIMGVKLGLSNIVIMYSLFYLRKRDALFIAILKSFFVFLIKGPISGILSLSGGLLSLWVIIILSIITNKKISYLLSSVSGAIAHNVGQFIIASFILGTPLWYYLPILLFSGIGAGILTSILLRLTLPALQKIK